MDPALLAKHIADTTSQERQAKYMKGQTEHGGDFAVKPTVNNIREESLDLINYTHVLIEHRDRLLTEIDALVYDLPGMDQYVIKLRLKKIRELARNL